VPVLDVLVDAEDRLGRRFDGDSVFDLHLRLCARERRWFVRPNVRAKPGTTVGRQAPTTENVHRTCGRGLVARRWGSA
jgi:hypothetical protein